MTQADLFGEPGLEPAQQQVARQVREQEQQLRRVHGNLREAILEYLRKRQADAARAVDFNDPSTCFGPRFRMSDLQEYVGTRCACAPGSPERILRLLRREGHCNYECVSRTESLYAILDVSEAA